MATERGIGEQEATLRAEIEKEAERKVARILGRARRDAEKALAVVRERHERRREQRLAAAEQTAAEQCRAITASIVHEKRKRWLLRREQVLDALFADLLVRARKGDGFDAAAALRELAVEAVAGLGPGAVRIRVAAAAVPLFSDTFSAEIRKRARPADPDSVTLEVVGDAAVAGGVVAERVDGKRRFDNTYATRLTRLKQPFRATLANKLGPEFSMDEQERVENA